MTDRELLELAAKAYWSDEINDVCSVRWLDKDECIGFTHGDNQDYNGQDVEWCWNPLTDDGDALRLAVKCKIDVEQSGGLGVRSEAYTAIVCHWAINTKVGIQRWESLGEPNGEDTLSSTRRAIVRAAAAIGEAMP